MKSLAQLEMRVVLAELLFIFDFKLVDDNIDWIRDNTCVQFWKKPALPVQFTRRPGIELPSSPSPEHISTSHGTSFT